ncbi:ornithine cyclodeaminase family protein [Agrobacterium salinitolerans]|uniref:ornithine cyclodeaminase family protein n=1 Tax=Agrobacterium salinitolerans TaxID=1183413 RepID=UPI0022B8228B|nr:hypothetical protein [Agrobacterium salinitolerans]MCZ7888938.1 hypothetical protein [Agrobacterium salinitolerans]
MMYLSAEEIEAHSDLVQLIYDMERDIREGRLARMKTPLRSLARSANGDRLFLAMPCLSEDYALYTAKLGTVANSSRALGKSAVSTLVVAFNATTGEPIAVLEGHAVTHLKCAAIAALVTKRSTRPTVDRLGVIGAGALARAQILGISKVRKLSKITIFSREQKNIIQLISWLKPRVVDGIEFQAARQIGDAVKEHDVVCTATTSGRDLFMEEWLEPEVHINCMGVRTQSEAEVNHNILRSAQLLVEDIETALQEGGDVHQHATPLDQIFSIRPGLLESSMSVFSSSGHGSLDLITVAHILSRFSSMKNETSPHNVNRAT